MDVGAWGRQSIILRDARPIDPDAALEKRLTAERGIGGLQLGEGVGKDRRRDKGKSKGKRKEKEAASLERNGGDISRGAEAAHNDISPSSEEGGLSTYNDISSGNGKGARVREEDRYGFLYSISEADRH